MRLSVTLFGGFHAELNNEPIHDFRTNRARCLLAYLAMENGRVHTRERLAAFLWPESAPADALRNLRQVIYALRGALGEGAAALLYVNRTEVQLAGAPLATCDVTRFRRHLADGALSEAVDLYRGDLLAGLDTGSASLEAWLATERERCHGQVLDALETLAERALAAGDWDRARHFAQRQLAIEAWREVAYGQLMHASAMAGDRSAALAQFDTCRQILAAELGVPPGAALTQLHAQIQSGVLQAGNAHAAVVNPAPVRHNLPPRDDPLFGRDADIERIAGLLARTDCRLVTIAGPGGIGKTRLGRALAWHFVDQDVFEDGVYFVDVTAIRERAPLLAALAEPLTMPAYDRRPLEAQIADHLAGKSLLFVIDNFEQVIGQAGVLADLLATVPTLKLLVTSRRALDLHEEWHVPIDGLACPEEDPLPGDENRLLVYPSVAMFADRGSRARPGFVLGADAAGAARICRLVAGLPLAIELAAAQLAHDSVAAVAAAIEANMAALAVDAPTMPARHRSLRALMDQTWQELGHAERTRLAQLSIFAGGFTLPAAKAVSGLDGPALDDFIRASLVRYHPERQRYSLHELLRQYAADRLERDDVARASALDRHSRYFCGWVAAVEQDLKSAKAQVTIAAIEADLENILLAWEYAARSGDGERVYAALEGINVFYLRRHRHGEGLGACEKIGALIAAAAGAAVESDPHIIRLMAMLEVWQARFHQLRDALTAAHNCVFQALQRVEEGGMAARPAKAAALLQLGHLQLSIDRRQAAACYADALSIYQDLGDRWNEANVLAAQAGIAQLEGDYTRAERLGEQCLVVRRRLGAPSAIAQAIYDLATLARRRLDLARAEQLLAEAGTLYGQADHAFGMAATTGQLAIVRAFGGHYHDATSLFQRSFAMLDELQRRQPKAQLLVQFVMTQMSLARYADMATWATTALALARDVREAPSEGASAVALALHRSIVGLADEAAQWLEVAGAIFARVERDDGLATVAAARGYRAAQIAEWDEATRAVNVALRQSVAAQAPLALALALATQARVALARGDDARAVEVYADATRLPFVCRSPHFHAWVGRAVRDAARRLGVEDAARAEQRGRSRSLWSVREASPEPQTG